MDQNQIKKSHLETVTKRINELHQLIESNPAAVSSAITELLALERKTCHDNDLLSSQLIARTILDIDISSHSWDDLYQHTLLLCQRHAQLKQVVVSVVRKAMDSLHLTPDDDTKLKMLKALRDVSKGKMHVEYEYAKMTKRFAEMKEKKMGLKAAADVLNDVNVEALSTMPFSEKFEFLLEQFRLAIYTADEERADLTAEKFNVDWLIEKCAEPAPLLKRYYELLVEYHLRRRRYGEVAGALLELSEEDEEKRDELVKKAALYSALAERGEEVNTVRQRIITKLKNSEIAEKAKFRELLCQLSSRRFIGMVDGIELASDCFKNCPIVNFGNSSEMADDDLPYFISILRKSFISHNIKVAADHYNRMTLERLSELIELRENESEELLCELVRNKELEAKIDRPNRIILFGEDVSGLRRLDQWRTNVFDALRKIQQTKLLVEKINIENK